MTDVYLHINYEPPGPSWLRPILTRLQESSSTTLRDRVDSWGSSQLNELGLALSTKLAMLNQVVRRVDLQLQRLREQLNDESMINECIRRGAPYKIADKVLPYEILVDIDSFIFESRSAYEIVGRFLVEFFERVLKRKVSESELKELLEVRIPDIRWIEELRNNRILFFHNTSPWIAVQIVQKTPLEFELVVLKGNVRNFENPDNYIKLEQLRAIYQEFEYSLAALQQWVIGQIEVFEAVNE